MNLDGEDQREVLADTNMAKTLMLLSRGADEAMGDRVVGRSFECKTCNRRFPSFQALGGHRASHKKPRLMEGDAGVAIVKARVHECSICGLEFTMGQALGGHMRRHRIMAHVGQKEIEKRVEVGKGLCLDLDLNMPPLEVGSEESSLPLTVEIGMPRMVDWLRPSIHT